MSNNFFMFKPSGAHNDGTDFSSAAVIARPASGGTKLLLQTQSQNIRFTLDGTTPEAAKGFQLLAGDPPLLIHVDDTATITVIEEAATADVQYQWGA